VQIQYLLWLDVPDILLTMAAAEGQERDIKSGVLTSHGNRNGAGTAN
jgi:hypothetical protein